jgi:hypothetical protein
VLLGVELEDIEVGEGVVRDNDGVRVRVSRGFLIDTLRLRGKGDG